MPMTLNIGLFLLRFVSSAIMIMNHGWPKLMQYQNLSTVFPDPLGLGNSFSLSLAIFTEVLCAFFVLIGFFTRVSSILLFTTMTVAFMIVHGPDAFEKKELAVIYALIYFVIALTGPGGWSFDAKQGRSL
jgi:putative oxidoreductase